MKLYQKIARVASQKYAMLKWEEFVMLQKLLPIGNGIEKECVISLKSTKKRIEEIKNNGYELDFSDVFNHAFENYKKIALYAGLMLLVWVFVYKMLPELQPNFKGTYLELMNSVLQLAKTQPRT